MWCISGVVQLKRKDKNKITFCCNDFDILRYWTFQRFKKYVKVKLEWKKKILMQIDLWLLSSYLGKSVNKNQVKC